MATMPDITVVSLELSFRDYVAAQIMAACMTNATNLGALIADDLDAQLEFVAALAYRCADALTAARGTNE